MLGQEMMAVRFTRDDEMINNLLGLSSEDYAICPSFDELKECLIEVANERRIAESGRGFVKEISTIETDLVVPGQNRATIEK